MSAESYRVIKVDSDHIKKLNLKSFDILIKELEKYSLSLDDLAEAYSYSNEIDFPENVFEEAEAKGIDCSGFAVKKTDEIVKLLNNFFLEFKEKTKLSLELSFHDSDNYGDIYDEIDGHYFFLDFDEFYKKTDAAKKIKKKSDFQHSYYVSFG